MTEPSLKEPMRCLAVAVRGVEGHHYLDVTTFDGKLQETRVIPTDERPCPELKDFIILEQSPAVLSAEAGVSVKVFVEQLIQRQQP